MAAWSALSLATGRWLRRQIKNNRRYGKRKMWKKFLSAWNRFVDFMAVWPCQNDKKESEGYFFEEKKE